MNTDTEFYSISFEDFLNLNPSEKNKIFFREKIIVLKNKIPLLKEQIKSLCRDFGALYKNHCGENFFVKNDPFVLQVSNNPNGKEIKGLFHNFKLNWHSDFAHTPGDFHGTALYNYQNGEKAETQFIDTQKAYESLKTGIKKEYKDLVLPHTVTAKAFTEKKLSPTEKRLLKMKNYKINGFFSHGCLNGRVMRPLFPTHPKTGKKSIYLSPATVLLNQIKKRDYDTIFTHCLKYIKRFQWKNNDLLLFDNLSLIHAREKFCGNRKLYRIQFNYENRQ